MLSKSRIREILEGEDSTYGIVFMLSIQLLIVLSLVTFSLETLPNLSASHREILNLIELFTIVIFSIEYLLRLITAKKS